MSTKVKEGQELTPQQEQVITLLLSGKTQKEAAEDVGMAAETVSRWMSGDAQFVAMLNLRRRELWEMNRDRLRNLAEEAITTMEDIMQTSGNDGVRLRAAMAVLQQVGQFQESAGSADPERIELQWQRAKVTALETSLAFDF